MYMEALTSQGQIRQFTIINIMVQQANNYTLFKKKRKKNSMVYTCTCSTLQYAGTDVISWFRHQCAQTV